MARLLEDHGRWCHLKTNTFVAVGAQASRVALPRSDVLLACELFAKAAMGNENCCSNKQDPYDDSLVKQYDMKDENCQTTDDEPRLLVNLPGQGYKHYPTPLFYVEKHVDVHDVKSQSALSSGSGKSGSGFNRASSSSRYLARHTVTKTLSVLQGEVGNILNSTVDKEKLSKFQDQLEKGGIDTSSWGRGENTKTVDQLFWEVHIQRGSIMISLDQALKRLTHILKIRLLADIFGVEHILLSRLQMVYSGETTERRQLPLIRLQWPEGFQPDNSADPLLSSAECPYVESVKTGVKRTLKERLGLSESWQEQFLEEDVLASTHRLEDDNKSPGFPGLLTCYSIHEVTLRITDPENPGVVCIGLPSGEEFATTEGDFNFSMFQQEEGFPIGTQLNIWTWQTSASFNINGKGPGEDEPPPPDKKTATTTTASGSPAAQPDEAQQRQLKQVPVLKASDRQLKLVKELAGVHSTTSVTKKKNFVQTFFTRRDANNNNNKILDYESAKNACPYLLAAQEGQETDWKRIRLAAANITSETYSLQDFNTDISAFPELFWYLLEDDPDAAPQAATSSGRTLNIEFQRTVGAFFAIYWLMRLRGDGKDGFSFGVDKEWRPVSMRQDKRSDEQLYPPEKRIKFLKESNWEYFEKLLIDAELLLKDKRGQLKANEKRVTTLLALTAIHDLMKVQLLLPTVQPQHAPYHEYKVGDTIADHDHALSYIMDYFPQLLPSFNGLDSEEKTSVKFTQCQLQFNHGWFVQAEAPPGAIFTAFRELLIRKHKSQLKERDIALYFVHWLTDLAGAEPTPLGGCEKFVVKFPLPVLNSFLRSFSFVQKISDRTETQVMEEYLCMRWRESQLDLGPIPSGDGAVAKMRLLCMAQMNAKRIVTAFDQLPPEDRTTLSVEMARTGCAGQCFSSHLCPSSVNESPKGPALLIYYGPAFLQSLGNDDPKLRLCFLAEVYRGARELWPPTVAKVGKWATVRVDTIKSLAVGDMLDAKRQGKIWLLVKHNESEAFVESSSMRKLNTFITNRHDVQVLDFGHYEKSEAA